MAGEQAKRRSEENRVSRTGRRYVMGCAMQGKKPGATRLTVKKNMETQGLGKGEVAVSKNPQATSLIGSPVMPWTNPFCSALFAARWAWERSRMLRRIEPRGPAQPLHPLVAIGRTPALTGTPHHSSSSCVADGLRTSVLRKKYANCSLRKKKPHGLRPVGWIFSEEQSSCCRNKSLIGCP